MLTPFDKSFLCFQSGVQTNSLNSILYQESDDVDGMNQINIINHSSYYDVDTFSTLADKSKDCFTVLSTNIQSINSKFSEFELVIAELKHVDFKFSIICMQECWISENDDFLQIQLEGYTCISQGKRCSSSGGLIIYADSCYNYELLDIPNDYTGWEGQFIKISGDGISKEIIIGNIYRSPKDLNEHYLSFINEFSQLLSCLQTNNAEVILAGDFNINLLQIN